MAFDLKTIDYLRSVVRPKTERFDLAATMHKWAQLARDNGLDELISVPAAGRAKRLTRGRRRVDWERRATVLLAIIYHEYSRKPPTRVFWKRQRTKHNRNRASSFYCFADQAFKEIGIHEVPDTALREAIERWPRSRGFSKRKLRQLLWA